MIRIRPKKRPRTEEGYQKPQPNEDGTLILKTSRNAQLEGEVEQGGTLNFGLVCDTPFAGLLNYNFYSGAPDSVVLEWFDEPLLWIDEKFHYTQDGPCNF